MSNKMTLKSLETKPRQIETERALRTIQQAVANVGARLNELENQKEEAENLIRMQLQIAETLCRATDVHSALQRVICIILDGTAYEAGGVYLSRSDGGIGLSCYDGSISEEYISTVSSYPADTPQVEMLHKGIPVYTKDRLPELSTAFYDAEKMNGFACIPMVQGSRIVGSINLSTSAMYEPDLRAREALESVSMHVADAIGRIEMRQAWKEQALQFRILAECTPEAIAILNENAIMRANKAFAEMMGLNESELIGMKINDLLSPGDVSGIVELIMKETGYLKASFITKEGLSPTYCISVRNLHKLNGYEHCVVLIAHEWEKRKQDV